MKDVRDDVLDATDGLDFESATFGEAKFKMKKYAKKLKATSQQLDELRRAHRKEQEKHDAEVKRLRAELSLAFDVLRLVLDGATLEEETVRVIAKYVELRGGVWNGSESTSSLMARRVHYETTRTRFTWGRDD